MTLQEGTHTITLTATDSAAQMGSASIHIQVFRMRPALPPTLAAAPGELTFRLTDTIRDQTVAIRNNGDGDLTWSAGADQPWIQLSSGSGSTPYNLDITADATGLALGEYSGQVTIDAPGQATARKSSPSTSLSRPTRRDRCCSFPKDAWRRGRLRRQVFPLPAHRESNVGAAGRRTIIKSS